MPPSHPSPVHTKNGIDLTKLDAPPPHGLLHAQRLPDGHRDPTNMSTTYDSHIPRASFSARARLPTRQDPDHPMPDAPESGYLPPRHASQPHQTPNKAPLDLDSPLATYRGIYGRPATQGFYDHPLGGGMLGPMNAEMQLRSTVRTPQPPSPYPSHTGAPHHDGRANFMENLYHEEMLAQTEALRRAQWEREQQMEKARLEQQHARRDSGTATVPQTWSVAVSPPADDQAGRTQPPPLQQQRVQQQLSPRRDLGEPAVQRRSALAASHPAQYRAPVAPMAAASPPATPSQQRRTHVTPSSPPKPSITSSQQPSAHTIRSPPPPSTRPQHPKTSPHKPSSSAAHPPSPPEPWRFLKDPMMQTASKPRAADRPLTGRPLNPYEGFGVVLSPVFMVCLPFGGMVELAQGYPDEGKGRGGVVE